MNWHGVRGRSPRSSGVLYVKLSSDEHILNLICDTGRSRIGVGSRGGSPRSSGVLYIKLSSDEHILYLICDTGRSRIGVGSRGIPQKPRQMSIFYTLIVTLAGHELEAGHEVLGNKLLSDEHAFYTLFGDNGRSPIGVGSRVRSPRKPRGFGQ